MRSFLIGIALVTLLWTPKDSAAQTTGGVFPPNVSEGHQSVRYRAAFEPDTEKFKQRLHYQKSLNDRFMLRGVVQTRKTQDSDIDLDFLQAELFWELSGSDDDWLQGFRFDARVRSEGRPSQLGANWMHRWRFSEDIEGRFVVLTASEIGDGASGGVRLQTRSAVNYLALKPTKIGLELYSDFESVNSLDNTASHEHSFGPTVSFELAEGISLFGGPLLGVSRSASDLEWRLWLTREF